MNAGDRYHVEVHHPDGSSTQEPCTIVSGHQDHGCILVQFERLFHFGRELWVLIEHLIHPSAHDSTETEN